MEWKVNINMLFGLIVPFTQRDVFLNLSKLFIFLFNFAVVHGKM